jgi:hypothetical protein
MLRSLKDLERYAASASDGEIGSVVNFLFDDERWATRYLVVDCGGFLREGRVLISPLFFGQADWATRSFHLALTKDKIKNSQHERDYYGYYGYPYYWSYGGVWGMWPYPGAFRPGAWQEDDAARTAAAARAETDDAHLRSVNEVRGYHIQGTDEAIGHVEDFIVDDETWQIRYLVIDTSNWWFGRKVLVAAAWTSRVSWDERKVFVDLTRAAITSSPAWDASSEIERNFETRLYDHYERPAYWQTNDAAGKGSLPNESPKARTAEPSRSERDEARLHAHEAVGGGVGALSGAALGAMGGPPGAIAGAVIGGVAGALASWALDADAAERRPEDEKLDKEIGVSGGDMGAEGLEHPANQTGAYSVAVMGLGDSGAGTLAEGPILPPPK